MSTVNLECELHEPTTEQRTAALAEFRQAVRSSRSHPAPLHALDALYVVACRDTGQSQAVRSFLFWMGNEPDPTGFIGSGGLELRRLDGCLRDAAVQVLAWWGGPVQSDRPLYDVLAKLHERFAPEAK